MNDRLKFIRKALNLKQEEFGEIIKFSRSHVSSLENGTRELTDRIISDVCREFNVNENWLRTGEGGEANMFLRPATFSLDEEAKKSNLSELEIAIMRSYMSLDRATRDKLMDDIEAHFKKKYGIETAATVETAASIEKTPEEIAEEEAEKYRLEVLAELKGETSLDSDGRGEKLG